MWIISKITPAVNWPGLAYSALQLLKTRGALAPVAPPLPFLCPWNDSPNLVQTSELNLYADDMELHCSNANLTVAEHDLHQGIQSVNLWLCVNLLILSIKKSNVLLIGSHQKLRNHDLCFIFDGKQLSHMSSVRYLGLHIDKNLS